jgi:MFS family permease
MAVDLQLGINNRYSLITLIFFIPYVIFQPIATVVLRKVGPRAFLSSITLFWGATMIVGPPSLKVFFFLRCLAFSNYSLQGFGFVKDWSAMMVLRVILGVLEAGFFPGCAYLLSTWYPRYELQKRNAAFYLIGSMASAFSGILAYGVMKMAGLGGLAGWRWIFVVSTLTPIMARR